MTFSDCRTDQCRHAPKSHSLNQAIAASAQTLSWATCRAVRSRQSLRRTVVHECAIAASAQQSGTLFPWRRRRALRLFTKSKRLALARVLRPVATDPNSQSSFSPTGGPVDLEV